MLQSGGKNSTTRVKEEQVKVWSMNLRVLLKQRRRWLELLMVGTESRKGQEKAAPTFLDNYCKACKKPASNLLSWHYWTRIHVCVFSIATALFSWECIPTFISLSRSAFGTLQFLTFVYSWVLWYKPYIIQNVSNTFEYISHEKKG